MPKNYFVEKRKTESQTNKLQSTKFMIDRIPNKSSV